MRRAVLVAASVAVALALALTGQTRAFATQQQICGNGGSGYCMNDWNGANQYVKMYYGGVSHEDFGVIYEVSACGSGAVTYNARTGTGCPFSDGHIDANFAGWPIVQVIYWPTGQCVGTTSAGTAWLGACADNSGQHGGTGVTDVITADNDLLNRYWSDFYGGQLASGWLCSGGNPGTYLYLNCDSSKATSWGGF
jgi:hypothetical protein